MSHLSNPVVPLAAVLSMCFPRCSDVGEWKSDSEADPAADTPSETEHDPPADSPVDVWDVIDGTDPDMIPDPAEPDPDPDPAPDIPMDTADGPTTCAGTSHAGCCWYIAYDPYASLSCTSVCSSHGGYDECTRTFAGSDGTLANCDAVLTALGEPNPGTTEEIYGFHSGVGCNTMYLENNRYWVAIPATTEGATAAMARRVCACNN